MTRRLTRGLRRCRKRSPQGSLYSARLSRITLGFTQMAIPLSKNHAVVDALFRVKRGLSAYVSYLAACEMNEAFSEYVLYEPTLRILMARGFSVQCEYECPGIKQPAQGDKKRLDFYAVGHSLELAIEVKWVKSTNPCAQSDIEKLQAFLTANPEAAALLCVFGRKSFVEALKIDFGVFKERGSAVYADLRKTKYGCRIFELRGNDIQPNPTLKRDGVKARRPLAPR